MCGIVGMTGNGITISNLVGALKKLEYRGYDSAGVAYLNNNEVEIIKSVGKIKELVSELGEDININIDTGIAHTRWATHGAPNDVNAHPHTDCTGKIAVVHNGIIENYEEIRRYLKDKGHKFDSETDTEVIAHLVEEYFNGDLVDAVRHALVDLVGAYAIGVIHADNEKEIVAARKGSPLVVASTSQGGFIASDVTPLLSYLNDVYFMEDGDVALVRPGEVSFTGIDGSKLDRSPTHISWTEEAAEKGGFAHFMLKEIFEEPHTLRNAMAGRIKNNLAYFEELEKMKDQIKNAKTVQIVACGTSYHAGLVFKRFLEDYAGLTAEIDVASEFRYRNIHIDENTLVFAISQSGETADTLEGIRQVNSRNGKSISFTNVVGSTISRESDTVIYLNAGPEIGVAASKTYVSQLMVLLLTGIYISYLRGNNVDKLISLTNELESMPTLFENVLSKADYITQELAREYHKYLHFMYIGRGYSYATALEGALKLKEISYIHASGYQSGELKHGPIALLDENFPVFAIVPDDKLKGKTLSNVMETRARNAKVVAICSENDKDVSRVVNSRIDTPIVSEPLYPLIMSPYLQLFAYHVAVLKGHDPDKPRNLAKSVTVE
ncbi:MAG: glutamine--fructose-6-phosphate transaminase (isomerizing) [Thermotogota bacterium]|nr:glutamine--fructose-6-phosphate transaminase (isomerizing) [Thermotogota bacterium]